MANPKKVCACECFYRQIGKLGYHDVHLTITHQSFPLPFVLQWKETQGGLPLPEISTFFCSVHLDWQPLTSRFPPFGLYTQGDCFGGYMSKYVCLVQLMSLDLIKTVLEWYKIQLFSNPAILQPIKRLFRENIIHYQAKKLSDSYECMSLFCC